MVFCRFVDSLAIGEGRPVYVSHRQLSCLLMLTRFALSGHYSSVELLFHHSQIAKSKAMPVEFAVETPDLASVVRPGDTVIWSQGPSEPLSLTQALDKQRHQIGRFRAFLGSCYSKTFEPGQADFIDFIGLGAVGFTRKILEA